MSPNLDPIVWIIFFESGEPKLQMNERPQELKLGRSKESSPCGPLCAIFLRGVASFPIQTPKRGVRPLWAKLAKGLPS